MYANLLSEMRRLLNVTKEELSQKSGITVEAQGFTRIHWTQWNMMEKHELI